MKVLIGGASGFIGRALSSELTARGHEPIPLVRGEPRPGARTWNVREGRIDGDALEGIDAVVNLAGRPITPRFTGSKKKEILESRRSSTRILAEAVADARPRVFVSGSAIGFYGSRGDAILTEEAEPGDGFLAEVVREWENASAPASDAGVRTVNVRTALVLGDGGLLPLTALPFRMFVGGPLGSGDQWWSWIAIEDEVRAILHCVDNEALEGPVNLSSPDPVTNAAFAHTLGKVLGRPSWFKVPAPVLELVLGRDAASDLVLASQRVIPGKLLASGFEFRYPDLERTLRKVLGKGDV